jgi:hypothetical protein
MSSITQTVLLLMLLLRGHDGVDGRTWRPSTAGLPPLMLHAEQHRPRALSSYVTTHPEIALLRGGGPDTFPSHPSLPTVFPGGSTSAYHPSASTREASATSTACDDSTKPLPSQSSTMTVDPEELLSRPKTATEISPKAVIPEHGGAIGKGGEVSGRVPDKRNNTEATTSPSSSQDIKAAIKEFKLRRKKEKEQRKRYKQIAKSLRVGDVAGESFMS